MPVPGAVFPCTLPRILRPGCGEHRGGSARPTWALPPEPERQAVPHAGASTAARHGAPPPEDGVHSVGAGERGEKVEIPDAAWRVFGNVTKALAVP